MVGNWNTSASLGIANQPFTAMVTKPRRCFVIIVAGSLFGHQLSLLHFNSSGNTIILQLTSPNAPKPLRYLPTGLIYPNGCLENALLQLNGVLRHITVVCWRLRYKFYNWPLAKEQLGESLVFVVMDASTWVSSDSLEHVVVQISTCHLDLEASVQVT